jgi:hypothetical protein
MLKRTNKSPRIDREEKIIQEILSVIGRQRREIVPVGKRPPASHEDMIDAAVDRINRPLPPLPHRLKETLTDVANAAGEMKQALRQVQEKLPPIWHAHVCPDPKLEALMAHLEEIRRRSEQAGKRLRVKPHSGNKQGEALRRRRAADGAFELYGLRIGRNEVVFSEYLKLATLLFELATGQPKAKMREACKRHLDRVFANERDEHYEADTDDEDALLYELLVAPK